MQNLSELNTYGNTNITFDDDSFTGILYSRGQPINATVNILEGEDFVFVPGIEADQLINPTGAGINITFDVSNYQDVSLVFDLTGTEIQFSLNNNIYTLSNIRSIDDWNKAYYPTVETITYGDAGNHDFSIEVYINDINGLVQYTTNVFVQASDLFTTPGTSGFQSDTIQTVSNNPIIETSSAATFTITVTPSQTSYIEDMSSAGLLGGTSSFAASVLTISGTKDQVNSHLNNITIETTTLATADFTLTYELSNNLNAEEDQAVQNLISEEFLTKITYSSSYQKNQINELFDGPRITNNAYETGANGEHTLDISVSSDDSTPSQYAELSVVGAIGYWPIPSANKDPWFNNNIPSVTDAIRGKVSKNKLHYAVETLVGSTYTLYRYDYDQQEETWSLHSTILTTSTEIIAITDFANNGNGVIFLQGGNEKVYYYNGSSWIKGFDKDPSLENASNLSPDGKHFDVALSGGVDKIYSWNGSTYVADLITTGLQTTWVGTPNNFKLWTYDETQQDLVFEYNVHDYTTTWSNGTQYSITVSNSMASMTASLVYRPILANPSGTHISISYRTSTSDPDRRTEYQIYTVDNNTTTGSLLYNGVTPDDDTSLNGAPDPMNLTGSQFYVAETASYYQYQRGGFFWDDANATLELTGTKEQINEMLGTLKATIGNTDGEDLILSYDLETLQGNLETATWTLKP